MAAAALNEPDQLRVVILPGKFIGTYRKDGPERRGQLEVQRPVPRNPIFIIKALIKK